MLKTNGLLSQNVQKSPRTEEVGLSTAVRDFNTMTLLLNFGNIFRISDGGPGFNYSATRTILAARPSGSRPLRLSRSIRRYLSMNSHLAPGSTAFFPFRPDSCPLHHPPRRYYHHKSGHIPGSCIHLDVHPRGVAAPDRQHAFPVRFWKEHRRPLWPWPVSAAVFHRRIRSRRHGHHVQHGLACAHHRSKRRHCRSSRRLPGQLSHCSDHNFDPLVHHLLDNPVACLAGSRLLVRNSVRGRISDAAIESATGGGVAWWAHVGGFILGMLLAVILPKRRRRVVQTQP